MLRRQPDVPHDREAGRREPANRICHGASAFQLHGGGAAFLEEPRRIPQGLFRRDLIRQKRHVRHDESAAGAARHAARVVNHGIESDRDRRVQSQDHLPQGVAHEQDVDPGSVQ